MMRLSRSLLLCAMGVVFVGCGGGGGTGETGGAGGSPAAGANGAAGNGARGGAGGAQVGTGGAAGASSGLGGQGGAAGSGSAGASGTGGVTGAGGSAGASGSAGSSGGAGAQGSGGNPGGAGVSGSAGNAGSAGSSGGAGAQGSAGASGAGGATGVAGASGTGGAAGSGAAGTSGGAGVSGAAGATGIAGASGDAGASGSAGASGDAGASGTAGASGSAGASGTAGASGSAGAGASGSAGASGTAGAGAAGSGGSAGSGAAGAGGSGASCQSGGITYAPRAPTVLIMADRSGSEFSTATTGTFFNVRSAVEDVIASVDGQYRLGLAVYTGQHPGGSLSICQVVYDSVPFALGNAVAIKTEYDTLGPLLPYGTKAETPAAEAMMMAATALTADPGIGGKYLLFITTGATDFCDDESLICGADGVTSEIQQLWAGTPSVETLVVGLPAPTTNPQAGLALPGFANAGVGKAAAFPMWSSGIQPTAAYYNCSGITGEDSVTWASMFAHTGKASPNSIATYAPTGETAPLYQAATTAVSDIEPQVTAALAQARSCVFDMGTAIDPGKLGEATVTLNGSPLPQDPGFGWSMPTTTELTLNGPACVALRTSTATIALNFPCDTALP
jgi:hypothetical protein